MYLKDATHEDYVHPIKNCLSYWIEQLTSVWPVQYRPWGKMETQFGLQLFELPGAHTGGCLLNAFSDLDYITRRVPHELASVVFGVANTPGVINSPPTRHVLACH